MTNERKVIRAKVGLLELARQLGHVSQACKIMGGAAQGSARAARGMAAEGTAGTASTASRSSMRKAARSRWPRSPGASRS
jgi:hypothetical protein